MSNLRKRFILDFVLTALLIFEMLYQYTGYVAHEVVGAIFFATVVAHVILSRKWFGATGSQLASGRPMKSSNRLRLVLVIAISVIGAVLLVSSIVISNLLFALTGFDLSLGAYNTWCVVHTVSSYAFCAVTLVHLVVHWASAASVFKIPYNPSRRAAINRGVGAVATVGVALIAASAIEPVSRALSAVGAMDDLDEVPAQKSAEIEPIPDKKEKASKTKGTEDATRQKDAEGSSADAGSTGSDAQSTPDSQSAPKQEQPSTSNEPPSKSTQPGTGETPSGSSGGNGSSGSGSDSASSSSTQGICTLCNKRCPLSAPKCNKPYRAGLI